MSLLFKSEFLGMLVNVYGTHAKTMSAPNIKLRELTKDNIPHLLNYWYSSDEDYLKSMGADINKLPPRQKFKEALENQIQTPYSKKSALAFVLDIDGKPSGHCNVNQIQFGKQAHMHLHIWNVEHRIKGMGSIMVSKCIPHFFEKLQLKTLWCEPYSKNPAPKKTLEKLGFEWVKNYITIPGDLNFEQEVSQYHLTKDSFDKMIRT